MKWISVQDKLPKEEIRVLVFEKGGLTVAYLDEYHQWCPHSLDFSSIGENPSHWMRLPELPPDEEWMQLCTVCKNHFIPFKEEDKCSLCTRLEPKGGKHALD